jgi:hypothetical protein
MRLVSGEDMRELARTQVRSKNMEEVDGKTQAEMAIKLSDNVRDLVRMHVKEALEDMNFVGCLNTFPLAQSTQRHLNASEYTFQNAVKTVIANQMNKY